jgi:hypothetical protein
MIDGQQVIGFTPVGRKRYMDILAPYIMREHERGHIDKWILFNNAYLRDDSTLCQQIAAQFPWCEVIDEVEKGGVNDSEFRKFAWHPPTHICGVYKFLTAGEGTVYVRLDDDLCYIDDNAIERLVRYRIAHPEPSGIGSRYYLHSRNAADAMIFILKRGAPTKHVSSMVDRPDRYHIAGGGRLNNLELVLLFASLMRVDPKFVTANPLAERPGFDAHYGRDDCASSRGRR